MLGKATGMKAVRYQRAQVSELFSIEICDRVVMDFLVAMDVGKFPPGQVARGKWWAGKCTL